MATVVLGHHQPMAHGVRQHAHAPATVGQALVLFARDLAHERDDRVMADVRQPVVHVEDSDVDGERVARRDVGRALDAHELEARRRCLSQGVFQSRSPR